MLLQISMNNLYKKEKKNIFNFFDEFGLICWMFNAFARNFGIYVLNVPSILKFWQCCHGTCLKLCEGLHFTWLFSHLKYMMTFFFFLTNLLNVQTSNPRCQIVWIDIYWFGKGSMSDHMIRYWWWLIYYYFLGFVLDSMGTLVPYQYGRLLKLVLGWDLLPWSNTILHEKSEAI